MGGAHAVAAFAYGTETVRRVDKIVGPGNAWVTAAKKIVVGDVGIDGIAGPSEVVIVADGTADPGLVAADLLAQAEHDPQAAAVLDHPGRQARQAGLGGGRAPARIACRRRRRPGRRWPASAPPWWWRTWTRPSSWSSGSPPSTCSSWGPRPRRWRLHVRAAGAIFIGAATPEVFGDYVAGPSHVLPTCGSARFASALGVEDFLRRSHTLRFSPVAASHRAAAAAALAEAEGLPGHAAAARRRMG